MAARRTALAFGEAFGEAIGEAIGGLEIARDGLEPPRMVCTYVAEHRSGRHWRRQCDNSRRCS